MPYQVTVVGVATDKELDARLTFNVPVDVPDGLTKEECRVYMLGVSNTVQVMLQGLLKTDDLELGGWDDDLIPENGTMGLLEDLDKGFDID